MSSDGATAGSGGLVSPPVGGEPTATGDTAVDVDAPVAPVPLLAAVCHRHPPWRRYPYEMLRPMAEEVWLAERTCTSREPRAGSGKKRFPPPRPHPPRFPPPL